MLYSVIITTKDRLESLKLLIASIEKYTEDYELIVVNDASTDGTLEWLAKQGVRYSQHRGPQTLQNLSYAELTPTDETWNLATAWNLGVEAASGDFIQILNDDMEVTKNWLTSQKQIYDYLTASGRKVGVLATKLLRGDEVLSRGGAFRGAQLVSVPPPEEVKPVDYSNTPFFKKELWKKVGGFTHFAKIYYEDADFGLALQKLGYINYYNPLSVIFHTTLGFLPSHGEEQYKRRQHHENIDQAQAREAFMKKWEQYLLTEHENYY